MVRQQGHQIRSIEPGSIAADLGLQSGDSLLTMDQHPLIDIFDYRLRQLRSHLVISVIQQGQLIEYDIEKDEDEDIGLVFETPLMQDCASCDNHCIFCFIDQLPSGLRESLYVKDDDLRLSFLNGNYATLTNLSDEALDRLIGYRFSPMNISVHTTSSQLRRKMIRHPQAGRIMDQLKRIAQANLKMNIQIVLCPGINDQNELDQTLRDLMCLDPALNSVAVVPVGLTRYREQNRLFPLRSYTPREAKSVIEQIQAFQEELLQAKGKRVIYASDEFFSLAGMTFPHVAAYEDFPQIENGVGMVSLMKQMLEDAFHLTDRTPVRPLFSAAPTDSRKTTDADEPRHLLIGTGTAAAPILSEYEKQMTDRAGANVTILPIINRFFGEQVTVAGLLTGQDIIKQIQPVVRQMKQHGEQPALILPASVTKHDEPTLLDNQTIDQISNAIQAPVWISKPDGSSLVQLIDWFSIQGGTQ